MGAVSRATTPRAASSTRLLAVLGAALLLSACGSPPQPLPTAPPQHYGSVAPSAPGLPSAYPSVPVTAAPPTYALPSYPTLAPPTVAVPTTATPSPTPAFVAPSGPKCTSGPTPAQVLAVVRAQPGIPTGVTLDVKAGPFCAGTWQFTIVSEAGKSLDQVDPLQVVTTGKPTALKVVEAGQDVCSDRVQTSAPAAIKALACG